VVIRVALEWKVAGWTPGIYRLSREALDWNRFQILPSTLSGARPVTRLAFLRAPEASITQAKPIGGKRFTLTLRIAAQQRGDVGKHTALLISEYDLWQLADGCPSPKVLHPLMRNYVRARDLHWHFSVQPVHERIRLFALGRCKREHPNPLAFAQYL